MNLQGSWAFRLLDLTDCFVASNGFTARYDCLTTVVIQLLYFFISLPEINLAVVSMVDCIVYVNQHVLLVMQQ